MGTSSRDPERARAGPRRRSFGGRPAPVLLLGSLYVLLGAGLYLQILLGSARGGLRDRLGREVALFGTEIPGLPLALLALLLLAAGAGLLTRSGAWARRTAGWLALACLGLGVFIGSSTLVESLYSFSSWLAPVQALIHLGLVACACALVYVLLDSAPVRAWYAEAAYAAADPTSDAVDPPFEPAGEAAVEQPAAQVVEEPAGPRPLGCLHLSTGFVIGVVIALVAAYFAIRALLEAIGRGVYIPFG